MNIDGLTPHELRDGVIADHTSILLTSQALDDRTDVIRRQRLVFIRESEIRIVCNCVVSFSSQCDDACLAVGIWHNDSLLYFAVTVNPQNYH